MSNKLRAAFEGEGVDALRHIKRVARLKNEWPELFDAVEEIAYTGKSRPVDIRALADSVLVLAEQISNPVEEVEVEESISYDALGSLVGNRIYGTIDERGVEMYLDRAIESWREIARNADHKHFDIAPYYVDAFQSVRLSLLGETLELSNEDDTGRQDG